MASSVPELFPSEQEHVEMQERVLEMGVEHESPLWVFPDEIRELNGSEDAGEPDAG
ncbi:hypothetical protein [Brachybacterium nesterenkovii]|uniref:Uncharacterized protein n=1 Tax=Brachybacterium nesterenkovii TaxID=47847 RepID=A0A1X6WY73_9MICO|nr:hypothetical protein [Brachybacterium nesterenkovii]SLM90724.1 hypothetical protein FM110_05400 [Brachybacterium nesterenkovii]